MKAFWIGVSLLIGALITWLIYGGLLWKVNINAIIVTPKKVPELNPRVRAYFQL